jgi:hypothetical protein
MLFHKFNPKAAGGGCSEAAEAVADTKLHLEDTCSLLKSYNLRSSILYRACTLCNINPSEPKTFFIILSSNLQDRQACFMSKLITLKGFLNILMPSGVFSLKTPRLFSLKTPRLFKYSRALSLVIYEALHDLVCSLYRESPQLSSKVAGTKILVSYTLCRYFSR